MQWPAFTFLLDKNHIFFSFSSRFFLILNMSLYHVKLPSQRISGAATWRSCKILRLSLKVVQMWHEKTGHRSRSKVEKMEWSILHVGDHTFFDSCGKHCWIMGTFQKMILTVVNDIIPHHPKCIQMLPVAATSNTRAAKVLGPTTHCLLSSIP